MTANVRYEVPQPEVLERRLRAADRPGEHLWAFTAAWLIHDPERDQFWLDAEGMVAVGGVGCFKCERIYSRKLARMRCPGSSTELQP